MRVLRILRSRSSKPNSSTSSRARAFLAASRSIRFARATWAKSRTRRSRRLATRGVPRLRGGDAQQPGRALHDLRQLLRPVEVEAVDDAEASPQRGADEAGAGGGPHQ